MYLLFLGNVHFKFEIKRYNRNLVSRYVHFKYQNVHLKIALYKSVVEMYIFKPQTISPVQCDDRFWPPKRAMHST